MSLLTAFYIIKRFLCDECSWPDPSLSYYFIVFYKENRSITISDTSKERWAQYCKLFHDGLSDQNENPIWPKWRHLFFLFVFLMFVQLHLFHEIFWCKIGKKVIDLPMFICYTIYCYHNTQFSNLIRLAISMFEIGHYYFIIHLYRS